jgi:peptidoglycan/LPS O-acetylase OafA/YrhL
MMKPDLKTDIGGLRAISVLMVVFFHFNIKLFSGGFVGVDLFFVISGYLMTKIIHSGLTQGNFSYLGFLWKRVLRIVPALFVLVAVVLVLGAIALPPPDLDSLARQALHALLFNSNNYYAAQQGYFAAGIDDRWLLHTWSLSVEWQFYMLYPALVWLGLALSRRNGAPNLGRFTIVLGVVCAASLAACIVTDNQSAFFSVLTRSWQMIAGGLVYLTRNMRLVKPLHGAPLSYAGLALIAAALVVTKVFNLEGQWPGYYAILPVLGACVLLIANYDHNPLLNNRPMQLLGAWSYSIYLWHWPIVIALGISGLAQEQPRVAKVAGIAVSIVLGYLSFRYIEPARRLRNLSLGRGAVRMAGVAVLLLGTTVVFRATDGLALRTADPALFQSIAATGQSHTYDPACENTGRQLGNFCHVRAGMAGPKVLVLGDSHAGHLYPWFRQHSKVDTTFYVKSGCPLITGFERSDKMYYCREFTDAAYQLAGSGKYQTVIISQNWTFFSTGAAGICSFQGTRCVTPRDAADPKLPIEQMRATINTLLARGIRVVVVDATPNFTFNVPNNISRQLYWHGAVPERARSHDLLANNAAYDQLFAELRRNPLFSVVSFRPALCQGDDCRIFDDKQRLPIFKDNDHINPEWIVRNGDQFLPYVGG